MLVDEGRQRLEERMLIEHLGSEDIQVALGLFAHLSSNSFSERLEDTLLREVPALYEELMDDAVEHFVLGGPDVRLPDVMRTGFLGIYWWKWHFDAIDIIGEIIKQ